MPAAGDPTGAHCARHEHINLVYIAKAVGNTELTANNEADCLGWYDAAELAQLDLTDEIRKWVALVLRETGSG